MVCSLKGIGDHEGYRLTLMAHAVVLEHMQALTDDRVNRTLVLAVRKPRRVSVRQDDDDARGPFRLCAVDGSNVAFRNRAAHEGAICLAGHVEFSSIGGTASHLLAAINAANRLSDNCVGHARAPAISMAR